MILGTLSVLRSNALNTGQNALRAVVGTLVGFILGAIVVELVGTNVTLLWFLLPVALFVAAFMPTAVSFAAGQAFFTLTIVILFNIIEPAGWRVGLVRVEDVAIGCAVSAGVALLLWPRGAAAELGAAMHDAYVTGVAFLSSSRRRDRRIHDAFCVVARRRGRARRRSVTSTRRRFSHLRRRTRSETGSALGRRDPRHGRRHTAAFGRRH